MDGNTRDLINYLTTVIGGAMLDPAEERGAFEALSDIEARLNGLEQERDNAVMEMNAARRDVERLAKSTKRGTLLLSAAHKFRDEAVYYLNKSNHLKAELEKLADVASLNYCGPERHLECQCGTRFSSEGSWWPLCPRCYTVDQGWLEDFMQQHSDQVRSGLDPLSAHQRGR